MLIEDYYRQHRDELVERATTLLRGDRMTAEDIVQSAFVRLLSMRHALCPSTLPGLVAVTVRRMVLDVYSHRRHEQCHERYVKLGGVATAQDVFSLCSAHQIEHMLEHSMARMDATSARILRMNIFEGKTVSGISAELGMKYKTAENRLGAARRVVRQQLCRLVS